MDKNEWKDNPKEEIRKITKEGYIKQNEESLVLYLSEEEDRYRYPYRFERPNYSFDFSSHLELFPTRYECLTFKKDGEQKTLVINEREQWIYGDINELKKKSNEIIERKGEDQVQKDKKTVKNENEIISYLQGKYGIELLPGDLITTYGTWKDNKMVKKAIDRFLDNLSWEYARPSDSGEAIYSGSVELECRVYDEYNEDYEEYYDDDSVYLLTNKEVIENFSEIESPINEDRFIKYELPIMDITRKFFKCVSDSMDGRINWSFREFGDGFSEEEMVSYKRLVKNGIWKIPRDIKEKIYNGVASGELVLNQNVVDNILDECDLLKNNKDRNDFLLSMFAKENKEVKSFEKGMENNENKNLKEELREAKEMLEKAIDIYTRIAKEMENNNKIK